MIGRLDRFVLGLFAASFALVLLLLLGLFVVFDVLGHLDDYLEVPRRVEGFDGGAVALAAMRYYALSVPVLFLQVAPFATLFAAAFVATRLRRSGELVPMLAAGRSLRRAFLPVFAGAIVVAASMGALRELALPALCGPRDALRDLLVERRPERILENVFLRDEREATVVVARFYPARDRIEGLEAWVPESASAVRLTKAAAAEFRDGPFGFGWHLEEGRSTLFVGEDAPTRSAPTPFLAGVSFSPRDILVAHKATDEPLDLSFREVHALATRDPRRLPYQTLLHFFLTFPLANLLLPLLGLPFCLRLEKRGTVEGLVAAAVLGAAYFVADVLARDLGGRGLLGPVLASWTPAVLFGSLGVALYDGMRT